MQQVETVGDCYVAVAGCPDARLDHASIMVRFARDIMLKMQTVVRQLEVSLGPDTADLSLRIGCHTGPGKRNCYGLQLPCQIRNLV